jgi:hypothetical protein
MFTLLLLLCLALPSASFAQPVPGSVIGFGQIEQLEPYLPEPFWEHRALFFHPGMRLEIGPPQRDYSPALAYRAATARYAGAVGLGPEGALLGHVGGQPFPMEAIDCGSDPQAGLKIAWNFDRRWQGNGAKYHFRVSFWDRGEELSWQIGQVTQIATAHRVEPAYAEQGGSLLPRTPIERMSGYQIDGPFEDRGIMVYEQRRKASEIGGRNSGRDHYWVYMPKLRRLRRVQELVAWRALPGTNFVPENHGGFDGLVPEYDWHCLGHAIVFAPMNTRVKAYPYESAHVFGPTGLSFADDHFELRRAVTLRMIPKDPKHPLRHRDLVLDAETLEPLYSFGYDRRGALLKVGWHNHRWSEDALGEIEPAAWYPGWEGVQEPRDLRTLADVTANVQTGTGVRVERWDDQGTVWASPGVMWRRADVGNLMRGCR